MSFRCLKWALRPTVPLTTQSEVRGGLYHEAKLYPGQQRLIFVTVALNLYPWQRCATNHFRAYLYKTDNNTYFTEITPLDKLLMNNRIVHWRSGTHQEHYLILELNEVVSPPLRSISYYMYYYPPRARFDSRYLTLKGHSFSVIVNGNNCRYVVTTYSNTRHRCFSASLVSDASANLLFWSLHIGGRTLSKRLKKCIGVFCDNMVEAFCPSKHQCRMVLLDAVNNLLVLRDDGCGFESYNIYPVPHACNHRIRSYQGTRSSSLL